MSSGKRRGRVRRGQTDAIYPLVSLDDFDGVGDSSVFCPAMIEGEDVFRSTAEIASILSLLDTIFFTMFGHKLSATIIASSCSEIAATDDEHVVDVLDDDIVLLLLLLVLLGFNELFKAFKAFTVSSWLLSSSLILFPNNGATMAVTGAAATAADDNEHDDNDEPDAIVFFGADSWTASSLLMPVSD